ncbi:hypothetical protein AAHE18_11G087700 [Arachis hypogaea]
MDQNRQLGGYLLEDDEDGAKISTTKATTPRLQKMMVTRPQETTLRLQKTTPTGPQETAARYRRRQRRRRQWRRRCQWYLIGEDENGVANDEIKLQECIKRCQRRWYKRDFLEMVACMGVCWHGMDPWRTRGDPYG